ncbi:MAG: O-antigen ligase family protein [Clostridia bacterium]|nr:O-antigen ligase family protein [Clostridia bacterium]
MQSEQPEYRIGMTAAACLWLGLFPLLQGGTYARITHDKWIAMLILSGVTLLCFCADLFIRHFHHMASIKKPPRIVVPLILASVLFCWTVLSCVFSEYGADTFWLGSSTRYEGLVSQLCYFALFACLFFSRVNLKPVLLSAAAGVTVFFVIVMLQRGGGNPLGLYPAGRSYVQNREFQGTIGNIDMGTGYLLLLSGLFLYGIIHCILDLKAKELPDGSPALSSGSKTLASAWRDLIPPAVYAIALGFSLFLIVTMDVQFGAFSLAVLFLFTVLRLIPKKWRLPLLLLLIITVLLVVWFWPGYGGGIWELHEILHGRTRLSFGSDRVAVWTYSLGLAKENLLLGGGSATFVARFNQYIKDHGLVIPKEQDGKALPDYFDNPHNEYIQQLTDHGLPALLLFVALLLFAVFRKREGWFPLLAPCSAAVLCYAVQAFFSFSVCLIAPMFWVVLGLSFREQT